MVHSRLAPSSFYRAQLCPGSVREEANFPDTDNEHSLRGGAAHQVAEFCLQDKEDPTGYLGQEIVMFKNTGEKYPVKMQEEDIQAVAAYVDYVNLRCQQLGVDPPDIEVKVDPGAWLGRQDISGTADCVLVGKETLPDGTERKVVEVVDYKHGYNLVEVEHNSQLILYAIGVCAKVDWVNSPQTETIKMTVVQPRAPHIRGPVRSWEIPAYELFGMLEDLRLAAEATDQPNAPLVPGEKQCKWCKAKATCPALTQQAMDVFKPVAQPGTAQAAQSWEENLLRPVEVMDLPSLVKALDQEALVSGWFKSIREHLTKLAKEGTQIPNYKLVHAQTRRKWGVDDEEVIKRLTGLRDITDKENPSKIKKAATMLADPDAMFGLPDSAKCKVSDSSIDGPDYVKQHMEDEGARQCALSLWLDRWGD